MAARKPGDRTMALAIASATIAGALLAQRKRGRVATRESRPNSLGQGRQLAHIEAARRFNHSSSLLTLSVLADSGVEHYRGLFKNPAMFTPLVSATLSLVAGLHGGRDRRAKSHPLRHAIYAFAGIAGVAGAGFHLYNVTKRTGGWSWSNLFYAAPLGAPTALLLSGGPGAIAERLRDQPAEKAASATRTAAAGIFPICGSATARCFPPWAGSIPR